jgi:hypothetical protein
MKRWFLAFVLTLVLSTNFGNLAVPASAAPDYQSPSYGIDEYFIGSGGEVDAQSGSYSLRGSIGDIGIGNSSSANYQIYGGYTTTNEPFIELAVNTSDVDLGVIGPSNTGSGTAEFQVRSYLSEGYIVKHYGETLTNENGDTIDAMTSTSASTQGTEQFGFNLVANTLPASFGSAPQQVPDASFSFGSVAPNYGTANQFRFVSGETIASSPTSTGQTTYTISYIANVGGITGAGLYQTQHSIIVTATY